MLSPITYFKQIHVCTLYKSLKVASPIVWYGGPCDDELIMLFQAIDTCANGSHLGDNRRRSLLRDIYARCLDSTLGDRTR